MSRTFELRSRVTRIGNGRRNGRRTGRGRPLPLIYWIWIPFFFLSPAIFAIFGVSETVKGVMGLLFVCFMQASCIIAFVPDIRISVLTIGIWLISALTYAIFWPSADREVWGLIAIAPFLVLACLAYGLFCFCVLIGLILLLVTYLPFITYRCSFRHLVIRLPRYRREDLFDQSQLCEFCHSVLRNSSLLCGTWILFTRTEEWHQTYATIEEMQQSWRGCHLCEALLSRVAEGESRPVSENPRSNYGTISSAQAARSLADPENGSVMVKVRLYKGSTFRQNFGMEFTIQLYTDDDIKYNELLICEGNLVSKPDAQDFTGSKDHMEKIKDWIDTCSEHEACKSRSPSKPFLPSRLLFVGTDACPDLRLVSRSNLLGQSNIQYSALSHCWGGDIEYKLKTTNYPSMEEGINIDLLSRNFQDAISTTRRIGISYLWIDSLCILQDSADDWSTESPTMGQVFSGAVCVISATASESSSGGCFRQRLARSATWNLLSTSKTRYYISTHVPSMKTLFDTRVETAPLTKRAWAFQERLLSRRLVHFCSDAVLFECNTIQASEFHSKACKYDKEPYVIWNNRIFDWLHGTGLERLLHLTALTKNDYFDRSASRGIRGALDVLQSLGDASEFSLREKLEFNSRWYELVSAYTEAALTRSTDKLIALSGIATLLQSGTNSPYLAGHWGSILLELGLLWRVRRPGQEPPSTCAPSWSWASSNGRVDLLPSLDFTNGNLKHNDIIFDAKVIQTTVSWEGTKVTSAKSLVDGGYLDISGPVAKVSIIERQPRLLRFVEGEGHLEKKFTFFPDSTFDALHPGTLSSTTLPPSNGSSDSQLVALRVLTISRADSTVQICGIVLRLKLEKEVLPEFVRVGVFCTSSFSSDHEARNSGQWKQAEIRIL